MIGDLFADTVERRLILRVKQTHRGDTDVEIDTLTVKARQQRRLIDDIDGEVNLPIIYQQILTETKVLQYRGTYSFTVSPHHHYIYM